MVAMPTPAAVAQSDLVLVCTVKTETPGNEQTILLPGAKQPIKRWYRRVRADVNEILHQTSVGAAVAADETIEIVMMAEKPVLPPPNGMRIHMADGPSYPSLKAGDKYLLMLRWLPEEKVFYLPADGRLFMRTDAPKERVEALKAVSRVADWPWGKVVDGLQFAFMPESRELVVPRGGGQGHIEIGFAAVLRNVSDKPIAVNHYGHDHFMLAKIRVGDAAPEALDLYEGINLRQEPFGLDKVTVVKPGELLLLARYGVSPYGDYLRKAPHGGRNFSLLFVYRSQREGETVDGIPLWRGVTAAAPVPFKVVAR